MGQKINPIGLRLGINRTWDSRWFAGKNEYAKLLHEDIRIREMLMKELKQAAVARIVIERPHKKCRVTIHSARPGVVIGKKGADIDKARAVASRIEAGTVWINQHGMIHPMVPFGGTKGSGWGVEFGVDGLKAVTQPQVISIKK